MPYIGTSPSNSVRRVHTYTATANQTTFTGASSEGITLSYADTNYIDVFQNGVLLGSADYTSTSGTSVVLAQGASADDLIVIVVYDVFSVADTVSKTNGGSFDSAVTMSNNLTVSGAFTSQGIDDNADATAITIDNSENVGINETSPLGKLHVKSGDSGASVSVHGDELVVEGSANSGISILSGNSNTGVIYFGDDGDNNVAEISYDHSANAMKFFTNASERIRIDSNGNVLIGDTTVDKSALSSGSGLTFNSSGQIIAALAASNGHYINRTNYSSGTYNNMVFMIDGSTKGTISCNGSSTAYNTTSDHRIKQSVTYDFDATTRLKQLKPCRFNFIADADTTVDGFLAHEVQSVVPEAITGTHNEVEVWKDGEELPDGVSVGDNKLDEDGNTIPVYQGIDQSKLVPLLVKTIQELEARITALENAE